MNVVEAVFSALGEVPPVFAQWAATVTSTGGVVTTLPRTRLSGPVQAALERPYVNVQVARYPSEVWRPKVIAGAWRLPDHRSSDSLYGYYVAPTDVQEAAIHLTTPAPGETPKVTFLDELAKWLGVAPATLKLAIAAGGVLWLLSAAKDAGVFGLFRRGNPRRIQATARVA